MNTIYHAHYYGSIAVSNITCQSLKDMLIGKVQVAENSRIKFFIFQILIYSDPTIYNDKHKR